LRLPLALGLPRLQQLRDEAGPPALSAGAPAIVPGMTLDIMAKHSLDFWLTSEDLPDPNNRVTLDRDGNIVLAFTPKPVCCRSRRSRTANRPAVRTSSCRASSGHAAASCACGSAPKTSSSPHF